MARPHQVRQVLGETYDRKRDFDLHAAEKLPLDDRIVAMSREYALLSPDEQSRFRKGLLDADVQTLMDFAVRAAALALRTGNPQWLIDGINAVSLLDYPRVDWREKDWNARILFAVSHQMRIDPIPSFVAAAANAKGGMSEVLLSFENRDPRQRKVSAWPYQLIELSDGIALVEKSTMSYRPTMPFDRMLGQIDQLLRDNRYATHIKVGTPCAFERNWLSRIDDAAVEKAIESVVASATCSATPSPDANVNLYHRLRISLLETGSETDAKALASIARKKEVCEEKDALMAAVQFRQLFCLISVTNASLGGSFREDDATIQRFVVGIEQILRENNSGFVNRMQSIWRRLKNRRLASDEQGSGLTHRRLIEIQRRRRTTR
jgi:hypothetical protein